MLCIPELEGVFWVQQPGWLGTRQKKPKVPSLQFSIVWLQAAFHGAVVTCCWKKACLSLLLYFPCCSAEAAYNDAQEVTATGVQAPDTDTAAASHSQQLNPMSPSRGMQSA